MKLIGKIFKILGIITLVIFLLAIAIVIFIPSKPEQKYSNVITKHSKANLNIRRSPGTKHEILKTVEPNTKLMIFDSTVSGFIMILNDDSTKYGWASEKYLQKNPLTKNQLEELANKITIQRMEQTVTQSSTDDSEILEYEIIKKQKVGLPTDNNMVYRIVVSVEEIPTDKQMKKTATEIWKNGNTNWNEFTVFIYLPEMDLNYSAYGIFEFTPSGLNNFFKSTSNLFGTKYLKKIPIKIEKQEPEEYSITISNSSFNEYSVAYEIETDIPLPVEVMISIGLANLKPAESAIGTSERIKITQSPFVHSLDISNAELPSGMYETKVTFYSNWGAKNSNNGAKKIKGDITGKNQIELQTSYGTAEERKAKDKKQRWVIENVIIGTPWDIKKFNEELGEYEELKVTNRNPEIIKVYYFNEADMTIFVNKLKNNVATWRMGEANTL